MKNTTNVALEKLQSYINDTGSTWYPIDGSNKKMFQNLILKNILVEKNGFITHKKIWNQERTIAKYAIARLHYNEDTTKHYKTSFLDLFIALFEKKEKITLDTWQKEAVYLALNSNLFILTGGPGTGKTSVLKCIRFCLQNILKTQDILFCAPTGKAARRITESVGCNAQTVAKALGLIDETSTPKKLNNKVVIVDEVSMLDTCTAEALFKATSLQTKLILVGDVEQLPSVGYGSVLRDLIDAGLPCIKLEKTFRQASESGLFANIEQVKSGLHMGFIKRQDFKVFHAPNKEQAKEIIVNQFLEAVKTYGLDQVVCLTPFRKKGTLCAISLNNTLQSILNPYENGKPSVSYTITEEDGFSYSIKLFEKDPVMQLVNAYKVANGDVGVVERIDPYKKTVLVKYSDCSVLYKENELGQLTLSYAMSIHKSQGSEYNCVITSALAEDMDMLSRNTLYTAITRAKKECIMVTEGCIAKKACEKETGYERITGLLEEIKKEEIKYRILSHLATSKS